MPFFKIHKSQSVSILAACDESIMGKSFHFNGIEIKISEHFYGKNRCSVVELEKLMLNAGIINLMGENCVKAAVGIGITNPSNVIYISGGVPHVQIVRE